jgi:hypothetical protein
MAVSTTGIRGGAFGTLWLLAPLSLLAALLLVLGVSGGVAQAAVAHEFLTSITEVPATGPHGEAVKFPGPLEELSSGLAVDGESGALFAPEAVPNSRLDVFDGASGAFAGQIAHVEPDEEGAVLTGAGIAVGRGTGSAVLYAGGNEVVGGEEHGVVGLFSESGASLGVWSGAGTPSGRFVAGGVGDVSADGSLGGWQVGDVYVANTAADVVDVFRPGVGGKEEFVVAIEGPEAGVPFTSVSAVAVSGLNGDVYVADAHKVVDVFKPTAITGQYELTGHLTGPPPTNTFRQVYGLAVDGGTGEVYVSEGEAGVVDEFAATGAFEGQLTGTPSGGFGNVLAVAVDGVSHRVFVAEKRQSGSIVDVFGGDVVLPDVETGEPSSVRPEGAVLSGSVNPVGAGVATCAFVWGTTEALSEATETVACEGVGGKATPVSDGNAAVPVKAALSGLKPDTTYFYRLQATNTNGTNSGEAPQTHSFTTPGPGTRSESVAEVNATAATLQASIDPHGEATRYYFQYTTANTTACDANPAACTAVPAAPGAEIPAGEGAVEVSRSVSALTPSTVYHYRVVTVRKAGTAEAETFPGPDHTFTTQGAGRNNALPDGRAWEQVSPPEKHGAAIQPIAEQGVVQAAETGDALTYLATSPLEEDAEGNSNHDQILSLRTPSGWSTQTIATPHQKATGASGGEGQEYRAFSADLSVGLVRQLYQQTGLLSAGATEASPYLRTNFLEGNVQRPCDLNCYTALLVGCPESGRPCASLIEEHANVPPGTVFGNKTFFVTATPDARHIILNSATSLESGDPPGLYEWNNGTVEYVGQPPNGAADGAIAGMSDDGSRIVMYGSAEGKEGLLLRDMVLHQTLQLDAVQGGSGNGPASPLVKSVTRDAAEVVFTDQQKLTSDSQASEGSPDLYQCRVTVSAAKLECQLTDLSVLANESKPADVVGALGGASEGGRTYFVANGYLAPGAIHNGTCVEDPNSEPADALCNLYVREAGVTRFIAVLSGDDAPNWDRVLKGHTARVSSDGGWLVFMSDRALTGFDNRDAVTGQSDEEVFLYHATDGSLVCVSCDPSGARPVGVEYGVLNAQNGGLAGGDRVWSETQGIAGSVPGWTPYEDGVAVYQSRSLSDSGRVFFNSAVGLVSGDGNGSEDVYEFEPSGVGGCAEGSGLFVAGEDGCLGLISGGTSGKESAFLDASGTGGDVFFLTSARLAASDIDTSVDVYDAHECTVLSPCIAASSAVPPPCDTGDSCRAAPSPQPGIFGAPSSATFAGAGNLPASASPAVKAKAKPLTRAQKLAKALKACHTDGRRVKRRSCEKEAQRKYGAKDQPKKTTRRTK